MFRAVTCSSSGGQIVLLLYYITRIIVLLQDRSPISRVTIPEAVIIQFVLLKMSKLLLETC